MMKLSPRPWHIVVGVVAAMAAVVGLGLAPTLAASNVYRSPITSGPQILTISIGGSLATLRFGEVGSARSEGAMPAGYTEQEASVTLNGTGINSGFSATEHGYWEYNGTYAYRLDEAPYCEVTQGTINQCSLSGNGAKYPKFMTWTMEGASNVPAGGCYAIIIYLYGNGDHAFDTAGPGAGSC
jgi:hypothetical protein